ncbi:hypothetical protein JXD20_00960 [Candidatus Peregrinibacteria bacterium]|nr:hypothetical protein [Candidatus Peregrinibacteria bacterium]
MSAEKFGEKEASTRPSTPASIIRAKIERAELRETLIESGLSPDQMAQMDRDMDRFTGPDSNSVNLGEIYAYLVREFGFEHKKAGPIFKKIRERFAETIAKNPPPKPNTVSGEHRLAKAMPQIPKQNQPFATKHRK